MAVKEIDRFLAANDDGSFRTTIVITQQIVDIATRANPGGTALGIREARTIDDRLCKPTDDNDVYEIESLGIHVRRVT